MDVETRAHLEARWEVRLGQLPPELAERLRQAPPPSAEQQAVLAAALGSAHQRADR